MSSSNLCTKEGLQKLKNELKDLTENIRPKLAETMEMAASFGDFPENASYDEAKDSIQLNEIRIAELRHMIKHANVVSKNKETNGKIDINTTVTLKTSENQELTITIRGIGESDPSKNNVSTETPLGKALLGKKTGQKIRVDLPSGLKFYEIIQIKDDL
jgi:transcription elongation factor GreA